MLEALAEAGLSPSKSRARYGVALLAAVALGLVGCSNEPATGGGPDPDGGGVDPGPGDPGPVPEVSEPDEGPGPQPDVEVTPPQPVCQPGTTTCLHVSEIAQCSDDGLQWESVEFCPGGTRCDPSSVSCLPVVCTPGEVLCVDGQTSGLCAGVGTGLEPGSQAACPSGQWCFDGEGCREVLCQPGSFACLEGGAVGECNGDAWLPSLTACVGPNCIKCEGPDRYLKCPNPGAADPVPTDVQNCPPDTLCVDQLGCMPAVCDPLSSVCTADGARASCNVDGMSWYAQPCGDNQVCVETSETSAECQVDCSKSVDCKLDACDPLPPFGDSGVWEEPENSNFLQIGFGVGLTDDFKTAFVNLSPIVNPKTGKYLEALKPFQVDPVTGEEHGHIIIREDGIEMQISCLPLSATEYAQVDVAFIMDTTGSMSGTIEKVKNSALDLATFWTAVGLDVRFGVMPYDDEAPSVGLTSLDFSDDLPTLVGYVSAITAAGGGDGPENGIDAIKLALDSFSWRPGAQKVMLLMTDAPLHAQGDGSGFTSTPLIPLLGELYPDVVVHTMSSEGDDSIYIGGVYPNPRLISCVTGGTAVGLNTFVQEDIQQSLFAVALAKSFHCIYLTSGPADLHSVEVEVRYDHQGDKLFGSATKAGVSYIE